MSAERMVTVTDLVGALEGVANLLRGMGFDRRIPQDTREVMAERAAAIDELTEAWFEQEEGE